MLNKCGITWICLYDEYYRSNEEILKIFFQATFNSGAQY